ncbi:Gldg family protein [Thalassolituus sp. LLYu03]|uniref:Gldg family protein n=1 Tax=Thalassolituus sp. LLYu03 TaxID=3421656 RepID=UPI003D275CF1
MNKWLNLAALAVVFVVVAAGLRLLGSNGRLDMTEQKLFTLSQGSRNILQSLNDPVALTLYFSESASNDLPALRAYKQRVEELLNEYALASGGRLTVKTVDPEPFSEEEDQAAAAGLQGVPIGNGNDTLYFGLTAEVTPAAADQQGAAAKPRKGQLAFLQPEREPFLEYELTKLIYQVEQTHPVVIGLLSGLNVRGGFDMQSGGPTPAWAAIDQLEGLYDVRSLSPELTSIDADVDVLMLIQPPEMTDATLYAIDQFALRGGRVLAFVDPLAEAAQNGGMMAGMMADTGDQGSPTSLSKLLTAWGVDWNPDQVVLDAQHGLVVSQGDNRPPVRHFGLLSLDASTMNADDVVTAQLESVNVSSAGHFTRHDGATTDFEPWLVSSDDAMLIDTNRLRMAGDLMDLQRSFVPTGNDYAFAVRLSGHAQTAFADGVSDKDGAPARKTEGHLDATDKLAVTLVADTDILTDRLWVQVQRFFGQRIATPWADNGSLVINLADHLGGSADLISLRARGQFSRPFEVVEDLRHDAEQRFLASEKRLQQELDDTEKQLADLQNQRDGDNGVLTLSAEQQQALEGFQQKKLEIRKELRTVQHELDKDIDALGTRLKVINIFVMPLLFTLLLGLFAWWRRRTDSL